MTGGETVLGDWQQISKEGIFPCIPHRAHLSIVPTQLQRLLKLEKGAKWLRGFEAVLIGGAASPDTLLAEAVDCGITIIRSYGMTESLGTIALQVCRQRDDLKGAARILPHLKARIIDHEIQLAGACLLKEYLPGECVKDEWFPTGDCGSMPTADTIRVVGRKDRMIISGGENIDPALIENAILQTRLVERVLVVGVDDPKWGQRVAAWVVPKEAGLLGKQMEEAIANEIPHLAIPKQWVFTDELPLTPTGKIDRARLLRDLL